jgi:hypothetical protein
MLPLQQIEPPFFCLKQAEDLPKIRLHNHHSGCMHQCGSFFHPTIFHHLQPAMEGTWFVGGADGGTKLEEIFSAAIPIFSHVPEHMFL